MAIGSDEIFEDIIQSREESEKKGHYLLGWKFEYCEETGHLLRAVTSCYTCGAPLIVICNYIPLDKTQEINGKPMTGIQVEFTPRGTALISTCKMVEEAKRGSNGKENKKV